MLHPKRPKQEILVRRAELGATTPLGRFALKASLSYAGNRLKIDTLQMESGEQTLAGLTGGRPGP